MIAAALFSAAAIASNTESPGISGLVVDDDGKVLENADVWINGRTLHSNRKGQFELGSIPDKVIDVRVERKGYYPARHVFSVTELRISRNRLILPSIPLVERVPGRVLFVFGGDVMVGRRFEVPSFGEAPVVRSGHRLEDIRRLFEPISWDLSNADFTSVNLETVVSRSPKESPPPKSVTFFSPPELVDALKWAGVDYVTLGNNHSYDYLAGGISDTQAELGRVGLPWSGAGRNEAEATKPYVAELQGTRYSLHGFVGWKGTVTPHQAAEGEKGGAALASADTIASALDADAASGQTGIVQFHDGTEYSDAPTERVRQNVDQALGHGASLVINHHPHVAQGFALKDGRLVAYSIGNLLFDQDFYETQASMLLKVWMDGSKFHRAEIVPLHIRNYQPIPALGTIRSGLLERLTRLSAVNGVSIGQVAGHGVNWASAQGNKRFPGPGLVERTAGGRGSEHDLWLRGDFESVAAGNEPERSWQVGSAAQSLRWTGQGSGYALSVKPNPPDLPLVIEQKTFIRNYTAKPLSFAVRAKSGCRAVLTVQVQFRGERKAGEQGIKDSDWVTAGSQLLTQDRWSDVRFELPRQGDIGKGFRVRLRRGVQGNCIEPMMLDDIRLLLAEA